MIPASIGLVSTRDHPKNADVKKGMIPNLSAVFRRDAIGGTNQTVLVVFLLRAMSFIWRFSSRSRWFRSLVLLKLFGDPHDVHNLAERAVF